MNDGKRREWADRLERFRQSGQTVAQFSKAEGVSQATFYQWKRKLSTPAVTDPQRSGKSKRHSGRRVGFKQVHISSSERPGAIIRLPNGIVIDMGNAPATIEEIVNLVLDRQTGAV